MIRIRQFMLNHLIRDIAFAIIGIGMVAAAIIAMELVG